jgi:four helix bundle protein
MCASIDDLQVLCVAEGLADDVWKQVAEWNEFPRDTVGKQLTRAVDSIEANISESFGRYHYGEKLQFLYYARGSVFETKYWLNRVHKRKLMPEDVVLNQITKIGDLARQLNGFLTYIKQSRKTYTSSDSKILRDDSAIYATEFVELEELFTPDDLLALQNILDQPNP